jgi:hypothetical protein
MDVLLFIGRIVLTGLLYAFLIAVFILLWRDLRGARQAVAATIVRERPARLRVVQAGEGFTPDQVLPLLTYTTLGRADSNSIVVSDPYASAEHAIIAWRAGQWWLEDRGSRNGTLLNNLAVDEPLVIGQGDVIGIGHFQFKFEFSADSA